MGRGAPSKPIRFKKRFEPRKVEIDGKDESTFVFTTVPIVKSVEEEIEAVGEMLIEEVGDADSKKDNPVIDAYLELIDKMITPTEGKKTKASKVLRDMWEAEQCETGDITGFFDDLVAARRPT